MWSFLAVMVFGGVQFGATEAQVRATVGEPVLNEERSADGSRALTRIEQVAGHAAKRKWVIRGGRFVEGILIFSSETDSASCNLLMRTALSAIEANYKVLPRKSEGRDSGPSGFTSELWLATLPDGGRIEQLYLFTPLIRDCTVSGRYFPAPNNLSAF